MARSRKSARQAGTRFESLIASTLAEHVDDRIERRARTGSSDRGDISGVRFMGHRVCIECKDVSSGLSLPEWVREAHAEAENDGALVGVVAHKRHGNGNGLEQWVTMTVGDLVKLLNTQNPDNGW